MALDLVCDDGGGGSRPDRAGQLRARRACNRRAPASCGRASNRGRAPVGRGLRASCGPAAGQLRASCVPAAGQLRASCGPAAGRSSRFDQVVPRFGFVLGNFFLTRSNAFLPRRTGPAAKHRGSRIGNKQPESRDKRSDPALSCARFAAIRSRFAVLDMFCPVIDRLPGASVNRLKP